MPGIDHELQINLLQNRPEIAPEILRGTFGLRLPDYTHAQTGCADLTRLPPKDAKADQVTVLYAADGAALLAVISEVQLRPDGEKHYTWPLYAATVRERLRCPVHLLVLCPDHRTANWARRPLGYETDSLRLHASVLGPDNTPLVDDPDQARRLPELAVLSAVMHGNVPGVLDSAQAALSTVPEHRLLYYYNYIASHLDAAARRTWEALMKTMRYEWQSDFARKYVAEGRAEGQAEGRAEGRAKGLTDAVVRILQVRGIALTDDERDTILSCTDTHQIDTWIERAAKADSAAEIFAP